LTFSRQWKFRRFCMVPKSKRP